MSRLFPVVAAYWLVSLAATNGTAAPNGTAAQRKEAVSAAQQLIDEALLREAHGLTAEREQLLDEAAKLAPDYPPARWHRGYVKQDGQWIQADDLAAIQSQDRRYRVYRSKRDDAPNTIEGQWQLAEWCRKRNLPDQERVHLTRVVEMDPNHVAARQRLGFQRFGDTWMLEQEIAAGRAEMAREREALLAWTPRIETIRRGLHETSPNKRQSALDALRAIDDPESASALEAVLSGDSEESALLVVESLGKMQSPGATIALARHAVYSPSVNVRRSAAQLLRARDHESYVPNLLSLLSSPIVSRVELLRGSRGGDFVYRQSFHRETQNQHQLLVMDRDYHRIAMPGGDRRDSLSRALADLQQTAEARERELARQNELTKQLNDRVNAALSVATERQQNNATDWWRWWTAENEVYVDGQKPVQTQRQVERVAVVDRVSQSQGGSPTPGSAGSGSGPPVSQRFCDCLAAGTPVWTSTGLVAIEEIRPGDVVLSQDPHTGELACKPVLATTLRPSGPLVKVTAGDETFVTSGGHLFWIAGEGWVKARKLRSGMEAHTAAGARNVSRVDDGPSLETYNLIVADFHTYFVGEAKILCHDNTVREPIQNLVPGLATE